MQASGPSTLRAEAAAAAGGARLRAELSSVAVVLHLREVPEGHQRYDGKEHGGHLHCVATTSFLLLEVASVLRVAALAGASARAAAAAARHSPRRECTAATSTTCLPASPCCSVQAGALLKLGCSQVTFRDSQAGFGCPQHAPRGCRGARSRRQEQIKAQLIGTCHRRGGDGAARWQQSSQLK